MNSFIVVREVELIYAIVSRKLNSINLIMLNVIVIVCLWV